MIPENISDPEQNGTFITAEGNRRVCALKLLRDPDLAPADKRKSFENAAEGWTPIRQISAVVFDDRDAVEIVAGIELIVDLLWHREKTMECRAKG